ncbi:GNAT family N-acetyltransferase [Rhizobium sp. RU36D]|uniref:GNAT family N-acetyltransferase n=1 Tax=Rhizobium sp. RU36D TaxID=1907415 RepID=UPI0009D8C843|nr:GNAT family N-acetyltransferase [Rhizobium sp. RU36D]SMD16935.1 Acetyltransferase (GNAT) domain-containing protein [Rhizobium sp. RU36D]
MSGREGLVFRQDYFDDAAGWAALKQLLIDIFNVDISPLDRLGGHDPTSFPSAYFDAAGRCVANLSAFSMPLVINGHPVKAAGWQSGAVRPEYRGLGLYRELIAATLAWCDNQGYEAIVLYTDKPGLYERYGFRIVPQYSFPGSPPPSLPDRQPVARDLHLENDLGLVQTVLSGRTPVSRRLAVVDQSRLFPLNCLLQESVRLSALRHDSVIVAWRRPEPGLFELLDVVGPEIPTLAEILAEIGQQPERVESCIPSDLLDWDSPAVANTGSLVFMMRAPDELLPADPSCLSPLADF